MLYGYFLGLLSGTFVLLTRCCTPKVLYGYFLGLLSGWLLCCSWELAMYAGYLVLLKRTPDARIVAYTRGERAAGRLFRLVMCMHVSSLPLHTAASLVQLGDVTSVEFMAPGALAIFVDLQK